MRVPGRPDLPGDGDFCPRCGLMISAASQAGSITGYLFQDIRCKCPPDPAFHSGSMTQKLLMLKNSERGQTFAGTDDVAAGSILNLVAGAIIGGAYEIKRLIGHGGMGEVYLAHHSRLDRDCALKVIPPDQVTEIGWMRFQQEARAVSKLNHVNVVQVSDLGIHGGCLPFYAMEYVRGNNLAELLSKYGPMPLPKALEIFKQVCDGVDYAHRSGIIHRDLKPANIMVSDLNTAKPVVKILDFGLAKLTQADRHQQSLTAVGDVFGSPFYMSPEQCEGNTVDNRSDIYSIGCALFECLSGRPPFSGKLSAAIMQQHQESEAPPLSAIAGQAKFPESLEILIAKMLRKNPDERYQNASEIKADLERIERGEAVVPYEPFLGLSLGSDKDKDRSISGSGADWAAHSTSDSGTFTMQSTKPRTLPLLLYVVAMAIPVLAIGGFIYMLLSPSSAEIKRQNLARAVLRREMERTSSGAEKPQGSSALNQTLASTSAVTRAVDTGTTHGYYSGPVSDKDEILISAEQIEAEKKICCDSKTFLQRQFMRDGVLYSQYRFPDFSVIPRSPSMSVTAYGAYSSSSMGDMLVPVDGSNLRICLSGEVSIPAAGKRFYTPSKFALEHPAFLQNFRNGDFACLDLRWPASAKFNSLNQSLQVLGKLDIKALNVCVSLNREQCKSLNCLKTIQCFESFGVKDLSVYLAELRGSQKLVSLRMDYADLTQEDLDCVGEMPHIRTLQIDARDNNLLMTASQFARICQLKELTHLYTTRLAFSEKTLQNMAKLTSLKLLNFTGDSSWGPPQVALLKKELPACRIYILRKTSGGGWKNFKV